MACERQSLLRIEAVGMGRPSSAPEGGEHSLISTFLIIGLSGFPTTDLNNKAA